jgi:DNA-binding MarR family transcriptional regulator
VTRWLSADEQRHWRAWLTMNRLLPEALDRDLHAACGIRLADYEILVHLSEAPGRRLRMADLAHATLASRSRLTHQVDRMARLGWLARERCEDDLRGQWAVMTESGWEFLREAAPVHVDSVRRHLVDVLGPVAFAQLGDLSADVSAPLTDAPSISAALDRD